MPSTSPAPYGLRSHSRSRSRPPQLRPQSQGRPNSRSLTPVNGTLSPRFNPYKDLEAQSPNLIKDHPVSVPKASEYDVATAKKLSYLASYFALNLLLTLYNKAVLGPFAFPWLLTALHCGCVSAGCQLLRWRGLLPLTTLNNKDHFKLLMFSLLFNLNIAISNVSLALVSIPFHQIMRSTCPIFAIVIERVFYSRTYSSDTYLSVIPIVTGVALATYGDYYFTFVGFFLTLFGVILASIKTVLTNKLMTHTLALPPLEFLYRMSPLAAIQSLALAQLSGELGKFFTFVENGHMGPRLFFAVAGNGMLAFFLNVSSFQTNKLAGALTITVAGNLKQCLTIMIGIVLFNVHVAPLNGVGMCISLLGAAWYSKVELDSKGKR